GSTGHPLDPFWQAFHLVKTDKKLKAKYIFCNLNNCSSNNQVSMQLLLDTNRSNQLLLEGIIKSGAPLSLVDSQKFKKFVYFINNLYHIPARKNFL
ncbi:13433_t:CDS:1, partial [Racocetra persica]